MTIRASVEWATANRDWEVGAVADFNRHTWLRLRLHPLPGETTFTIGPLSLFVRNT